MAYSSKKTAEDQFMRERNSTAINTTFVLTIPNVEKARTFLFLSNRLTFRNDHIVRYISYNYIQDISPIKTNDEYGFSNYILSKLEPLEGELLTIYCGAIGRNPPHVSVERNGMEISERGGVLIRNSRKGVLSISTVTSPDQQRL